MAKRRTKATKAKRRRYEVLYGVRGWEGRELGVPKADASIGVGFIDKKSAVRHMAEFSRARVPSQLFIKGRDGRIQDERTYGDDPRRTKG
jgi:hypothetical protein